MFTLALLFGIALGTPCASEDQGLCYWDAQTMGNGTGTSYVMIDEDNLFRADGTGWIEGVAY